ncbi:hypothetical protein H2248_005249 [Termitomyces sp. 'cryptogamus']|nr:hypothetical protein H2248_005249 [Termitomyces sp. 'cryptogamus']
MSSPPDGALVYATDEDNKDNDNSIISLNHFNCGNAGRSTSFFKIKCDLIRNNKITGCPSSSSAPLPTHNVFSPATTQASAPRPAALNLVSSALPVADTSDAKAPVLPTHNSSLPTKPSSAPGPAALNPIHICIAC